MIPVPSHNLTVVDGGIGIVGSDSGLTLKIGTSTAGTAGLFYSYAGSDTQRVFTELGEGPGPHAVAKHLIQSGGKPVLFLKVAPSTPGSSSAVTKSGGGPTVSLTGTPNDQYDMQIAIVTGGAVGTSTFRYTMDGGDTWSDVYATAATFLLPTGVTANFAAGTYVALETYTWTDTAPAMNTTDVGTALDAATASPYEFEFVHIVGQTADAASCATMAALVSTKLVAAWGAHRPYFAVMEAPAVAPSGLATSFASYADKAVIACAGFAEVIDDKSGLIQKRSIGRVIAPRIARNPLAVAIARDPADSDLDPLPDVVKLVPDGAVASSGYSDAATDPTLNNARFTTCMTFVGRPGYYPTGTGLTMASTSSDFQLIPYLRILRKALVVWYAYGLTLMAKRLPTNPKTGFLQEAIASGIEKKGEALIRAALGNAITGVRVTVSRTDKVAQTQTLNSKVRIVVGGYAITVNSELGFADSLS